MRLLTILGEFNSSYFNLYAQLARVVEINGEAVHVPNSEREIEVIEQRLGREGLAALMESIAQPVEDSTQLLLVHQSLRLLRPQPHQAAQPERANFTRRNQTPNGSRGYVQDCDRLIDR
jgi:hypothetical protein